MPGLDTRAVITPGLDDEPKVAPEASIGLDYAAGQDDLNLKDAIVAEAAEHNETAWQSIKAHPQAIFWTFVFSCLVIMEAFDNDLMGALIAMPTFRKKYGYYVSESAGYQVPASWQTAMGLAPTIGSFFGILTCGYIVNRLGYRYCALIGLALMTACIFVPFFSPNLQVLFVGEILCGFPWGFFICVGPAYASEIAPLAIRGPLTLWIQACWCIGHFLELGVVTGTQARTDEWAYKIPFAVQWVWPIPLAILVYIAPESPWWLVRRGRMEDAEAVVRRLGITNGSSPQQRTAEIARVIELEKQTTAGTSYFDCFKGTDMRRTLIAAFVFMFQNYTGYSLAGNTTYFFEQAGIETAQAFNLSLGTVAIQLTAVFMCAFATNWFGRRTIYLSGLAFTLVCLLVMGILGAVPANSATKWVQSALTILVVVMYGATIGPITYSIVAEISSVRLRAKTVAVARAAYYVSTVPSSFIGSYSLNPGAWNMKGKAAFIWVGTGLGVYALSYFFLPEIKGRSYRELDVLFNRRVPARQFRDAVVREDEDE